MIYVKTDELKPGMRLAKPIYDRKGTLLYDRNEKITRQGIESVKNFGLIGLYILEPAEPVPPMSEEEIEFERFQTMAVFSIRDILDELNKGKEPQNLMKQTDEIVRRFGNLYHRISFTQNLRSPEDYVYKHTLNVAILVALISHRAELGVVEQTEIVVAALLHDLGMLSLKPELRGKRDILTEEELAMVAKATAVGINRISTAFRLPAGVKTILTQFVKLQYGEEQETEKISKAVQILMVANAFDEYTAMQLDVEPHSELEAVRMLIAKPELYDAQVVKNLLDSVKILYPGVCVELSNFEKGVVLVENDKDVLRPTILGFGKNEVYNLENAMTFRKIKIKDIMKTMDNRIKVDVERIQEYMQRLE